MSAFLDAQPVEWRARVAEVLKSEAVEMAILAEFDFADEPMRLCNRVVGFTDLQHGLNWGAGSGLLVGLPDLTGGEDELAPFREYQLGLPYEWIDADNWRAELVGIIRDVQNYRGRNMALKGQLFDAATGQPVGWPFFLDSGVMDRMAVSFQLAGAVLNLTVESFLSRKGVPVYGMQTYQDQKRRHPTDEGLQFVTEAGRLISWTNW